MLKRLWFLLAVVHGYSSFASASASGTSNLSREAIEITFHLLKTEPTVGEALESLRKSGIVSKSEIEKAKAFVQSKNLLAAPLSLKIDSPNGKMQVGSLVLLTKPNGDLATVDGRLLGVTEDLGFSIIFERAFQRLDESTEFSMLDLFISTAYAEKMSMLENMGAAYAAADYAVSRTLAQFAMTRSAKRLCAEDVNVFAKASQLDAKRKKAYGENAGKFVCDPSVADGVRRYAPAINRVDDRDAERLRRSNEIKTLLKIPLKSNATAAEIKACEDSLSAKQLAELVELDSVYETDSNMRGLLAAYGLRRGTLFRCSVETIASLEAIDASRRAARLINKIRYSDFSQFNCGKLANCSRAIFGESIKPDSGLKTISDPTVR